MSKAVSLTSKNFQEEVFSCDIPVLVDFWGSWCPPCKMMESMINELSEELDGKVKVVKINVDQNSSVRNKFDIVGLPMMMLVKDGEVLRKETGARSKQQLLKMMTESGIVI